MRFKVGDRVILLDKTCGPLRGLRDTLQRDFQSFDDLVPKFGVVVEVIKDGWKHGNYYKVEVDNYSSKLYRHKEFMFNDEDLDYVLPEWIEDDLFVI